MDWVFESVSDAEVPPDILELREEILAMWLVRIFSAEQEAIANRDEDAEKKKTACRRH